MAVSIPYRHRKRGLGNLYDIRSWNTNGTLYGVGVYLTYLVIGHRLQRSDQGFDHEVPTNPHFAFNAAAGNGISYALTAKAEYELFFSAVLRMSDNLAPIQFDTFGVWEIDGVRTLLQRRNYTAQNYSGAMLYTAQAAVPYIKTTDAATTINAIPQIWFNGDGSGSSRTIAVEHTTTQCRLVRLLQ